MFIELLRRASKSNNTILCGRIIIFLAFIFPISEKSGNKKRKLFFIHILGLNPKSEINVLNTTEFQNEMTSKEFLEGFFIFL